jgi:hypothetical protein
LHHYGPGANLTTVSKILRFRRHKRPKGLEAFERPSFVVRLQRMRNERRLQWRAMVACVVVLAGAAIGWMLI